MIAYLNTSISCDIFSIITVYSICSSFDGIIDRPINRSIDAVLLTMSRYEKKQSAMGKAAYSPVVAFILSAQDDSLARKISGKYPVVPPVMEPTALLDNMVWCGMT